MHSTGFMSKYYDWASFETFVRDIYEGDGDVTVQRDVTETDRYGAKRQTDVKITRRSRFHRFTTLVECKRWKEPVSRDRIDVLASSIEALGANNGAIFTTTGFEEGAIAYAKGKGIELFVVRDLTAEEWGLPGRHVSFHLHVNAAEFRNMKFAARAIPLIDLPPETMELELDLSADKALDPNFDLFSVKTGECGPNLVGILGDVHGVILTAIGSSVGVIDDGEPLTLEISACCNLDLTKTEFHQLRLPQMAARIKHISFTAVVHISQTAINVDRGKHLDFAVMVESYVSDQRLIAHRRADGPDINFQIANLRGPKSPNAEEPLQNGSLIKVSCSPWVGINDKVADKIGVAQQALRFTLETEGSKPRISLVTQTLSTK